MTLRHPLPVNEMAFHVRACVAFILNQSERKLLIFKPSLPYKGKMFGNYIRLLKAL